MKYNIDFTAEDFANIIFALNQTYQSFSYARLDDEDKQSFNKTANYIINFTKK